MYFFIWSTQALRQLSPRPAPPGLALASRAHIPMRPHDPGWPAESRVMLLKTPFELGHPEAVHAELSSSSLNCLEVHWIPTTTVDMALCYY